MTHHDDPSAPENLSRRRFLACVAAAGAVSACGPVTDDGGGGDAGLSEAGVPTTTSFAIGDCYRVTRVSPANPKAYILTRDGMGFYAFAANCTHQRTLLPCPNAQGVIVCPNHSSHFNLNGDVTAQPNDGGTSTNLAHFQVNISADGVVSVDSSTTVDRTLRFSAPTT